MMQFRRLQPLLTSEILVVRQLELVQLAVQYPEVLRDILLRCAVSHNPYCSTGPRVEKMIIDKFLLFPIVAKLL